MNSLNLISSRVLGQTADATRPRSRSQGEALTAKQSEEVLRGRSYSDDALAKINNVSERRNGEADKVDTVDSADVPSLDDDATETTPFIERDRANETKMYRSRLRILVRRIADALTALLATIGAPIFYVVQSFQDENGNYSPSTPFKRMKRARHVAGQSTATAVGLSNAPEEEKLELEKPARRTSQDTNLNRSYSTDSLRSTTSESDSDRRLVHTIERSTRKKVNDLSDKVPSRRQSIRIKVHNEDALKKRKQKRSALAASHSDAATTQLTVDNIKSPTSPSPSLKVTRYPHSPQPTRPLIPRRQPSYSNLIPRSPSQRPISSSTQQKTLVLDLDETLIHSLAKGGRMSSGHMVEVKLNAPVALAPTQTGQPSPIIGPQHPILYYVHKRPHCDQFLRKVCKWYKLVIFTASVQEYADPVVDWLELERKYFAGRYYRQHCTFRNGAYIKDLSSIEPDLSKVIILDNSPVSYIFHEDNAIPIEGWINDPTDNDLLHLIPMLEALQYVTDVRALLALRRGEAEAA